MSVKSGQNVIVLFTTANASTGAATDATGTPTGTLYVNGTANGATVTVANKSAGVYTASVTLPSLSAGDVVSLRAAATVATVAGEGIIWQDVADTKRVSDLADASNATLESRLTATRAAYLDNLASMNDLSRADVRDALGLASANLDTQLADLPTNSELTTALSDLPTNSELTTALADLPTNAELATALASADDAILAAISVLNNLSSAGAQAAAAAALAAYDAATGTDVTNATSPLATAAAVAALNNLSQAQAQAAATAALNAYDGPTKTEMDAAFTTADDAVLAAIAALNNTSATDFLTALQAMLVDGAITWMELQRVLLALIAGETTGGGTTDLAFLAQDGLTERIAATVDGSGNRTSVTLDGGA